MPSLYIAAVQFPSQIRSFTSNLLGSHYFRHTCTPRLMLLAGPSMLSKLNPFNVCWSRSRKNSAAKPPSPLLSPSFLKIWRRSQSSPANIKSPKSPAVVTRSQVKRASTLPSSQAMAVTTYPRRQNLTPDQEVQPYHPPGREYIATDYFMDVNLRLTNTNATTATSLVSDLSCDLAR